MWNTMPVVYNISYSSEAAHYYTLSGLLSTSRPSPYSRPTVSFVEPFHKAAAELYTDELVSPIGTGKEG